MHRYDELVYRSTAFTLNALEKLSSEVIEELQTRGLTASVKSLQMIQLQKATISIGMFSLFESILQKGLACQNGFVEAKNILRKSGKVELYNRFNDFLDAINVLKHGQGRSYEALVAKSGSLPFKIKLPGENLFYEGDVSEISTLIQVDDKFVLSCAELIEHVSKEIRAEVPNYFL